MTTTSTEKEVTDRLEALGFKTASTQVKLKKAKALKMMLAYEHYKFVTPEKVNAFGQKVYHESNNRANGSYKTLEWCGIESYAHIPPADVLDKLETAKALTVPSTGAKVFDSYEIMSIREVKDPILFGRIDGCTDRFYIADWGEDVRITDLLKTNEG